MKEAEQEQEKERCCGTCYFHYPGNHPILTIQPPPEPGELVLNGQKTIVPFIVCNNEKSPKYGCLVIAMACCDHHISAQKKSESDGNGEHAEEKPSILENRS